MIETIETTSPKVLGLKLCGKLHDKDYKQFVPNIEALLTAKGKLRLFVQFEDFHGWDLHALEILVILPRDEDLSPESQYSVFHPADVELAPTTRRITEAMERHRPTRVAFDSLTEVLFGLIMVLTVTWHCAVPSHDGTPLQPLKSEFAAGVGMRVTTVPALK